MTVQRPGARGACPVRGIHILGILLAVVLTGCQAKAAPIPAEPTAQLAPVTVRKTDAPTATAARFELRPSSTPEPPATLPSVSQLNGPGYGPDNYPADVNPLTGLKVSDPARLERRPMVIKITNFPRSVRPQWGLNAADHVYEYYLEDELTRFIGVFYGNDAERVGPVRSARPFDEHIVRAYKGIFAFGYGDDRVIDLWVESDLAPFLVIEHPDNCPPMCRIGPEREYNTLFTNTAQLSQYITDKGIENGRQRLEGLHFEEQSFLAAGGGQASYVAIRFSPMSYHYWEYEAGTRSYLRFQEADRGPAGEEAFEPLFDSLDHRHVTADNLVILYAPVDYFFLSNSTEIYDIQLKGSGKGYALRDGRIFAIEWLRRKKQDMISLRFTNGVHYPLKPGNVWFEVLSSESTHETNGQAWQFEYVLPATTNPTP